MRQEKSVNDALHNDTVTQKTTNNAGDSGPIPVHMDVVCGRLL